MSAPTFASFTAKLPEKLRRAEVLALFPLLCLGAWLLGEPTLGWTLIAGLPLLLLFQAWRWWHEIEPSRENPNDVARAHFAAKIDSLIEECTESGLTTAALLVEIEEVVVVDGTWGLSIRSHVIAAVANRIALCLREGDTVFEIGEGRLGIALGPVRRADLDTAKSLAERIKAAVSEPIEVQNRWTHVKVTIGFCALSRSPERASTALLAATECALQTARRSATDHTCAFTPAMRTQVETENQLATFLPDALEKGEIRPWFQPQISAESGEISGFEALARWHHPTLGMLVPAQFLPAIAAVSALPRLGEVMLNQSLQALQAWDQAGLRVPSVGVNLSLEELRDPWLADGVQFELDRFNVHPSRVAIEILESVTLREGEEVVVRNLQALAKAGCRLELDDFGTGHASVRHVPRFGARRIKIDRSFVTGVDQDPSQKRLISAILAMAEQLGVETLAEGVETPGEHSTLAQLGCQFVQGFGLSRPMPFEDTIAWITAHNERISAAANARRRDIG